MSELFPGFFHALAALLAVAAVIPVAARLSLRVGLVDRPGGRKTHDAPVPPVGGVIIFPVFMIMSVIYGTGRNDIWFFVALTALLVAGAIDDRYGMKPWIKFAVQAIAALMIVCLGGAQAVELGNLFGLGPLWLGWASPVFSVIAVVLLINAVNLMDGLDGLAGGKGLIIFFWLALSCILTGQRSDDLAFVLILTGALAGFLVFNLRHPLREKATVFLGDSGSMALGLAIAWFSINLSQDPHPVIRPIAVAWLLGLLIFDTCAQFARRVREGRHPFDADDSHFHHHVLSAGLSVAASSATILCLSMGLGMIGVMGTRGGVPDYLLAYLWMALLFGHMFMSMRPERYRRLLKRILRRPA